jgi:ribosomal protein S18 acetylase RimI-like enzyme
MAETDRDRMLREMAANRGCRLVKSRRRKPGGDFGHYGLKDAKSSRETLGFGPKGLTATADEIEQWLRGSAESEWKSSLRDTPAPKGRKAAAARSAPPPKKTPEPKLRIREAAPRDAEAIAAFVTDLGFPATRAEIAKRLGALKRAGGPPLVAETDTLVGCLAWHVTSVLHRPKPVGRITMLVVAENSRRKGVGRALVEEAGERLAKAGCGLLEVTSNIKLAGAHAFYRRLGFERTSYRFARSLEP